MSIKLQLDVPALERLIKDDKEMEVKLKDGVILNFVDRKLRGLLKDDMLQGQIDDIKQKITESINTTVKSEIGKIKNDGWHQTFELKPEIKDLIKREINLKINDLVYDNIRKEIEEALKRYSVELMVKKYVDTNIKEWSRKEIETKAKEMMAKAMDSV